MSSSDDEYERRYMAPNERVIFREKVVSHTAFRVSIAFAIIFGLGGLLFAVLGPSATPSGAVGPALALGIPSALFGVMMGVLGVMFSVFRVMITDSHLHVHFGWSKRKIPRSAIQSVNVVKLKGFKQGKVSVGLDGVVRTWVGQSSSGRGLEITYQEEGARKNVLTIGSDNPESFAAALEEKTGSARVAVDDEGAATAAEREIDEEVDAPAEKMVTESEK